LKLRLDGHDYKYAVEQMMLTLFPDERPVYTDERPERDTLFADSRLTAGPAYAASVTRLYVQGRCFVGVATVGAASLPKGRLAEGRALQKIIRLSFYQAAVQALGRRPPWGALTGIRPGKLVSAMLEAGVGEEDAINAMERDYDVSFARAGLCLDTARAGLAAKDTLGSRDICLYVGIPFCPTRCAYCSFVSHSVEKSLKLVEPFLAALFREIDAVGVVVRRLGLRVVSVYLGGGTPTTLTAPALSALLARLSRAFDLSRVRDYTAEAGRPDTLTDEKLRVLSENRVTRVSVNPQTMQDHVLAAIGRNHTAADIERAVGLVRRARGFIINMDLIAGLPADSEAGFRDTLNRVLAFRPENITVHTLALKKGARITLEKTPLPQPAAVGRMLDYAAEALRGAEYAPYYLYRQKYTSGGFENVGWAKPNHQNLYNICMMEELCTVLALGGGGSTKLMCGEPGRIQRIFNAKYPHEYILGIDRIIIEKESKLYAAYKGRPKENEV